MGGWLRDEHDAERPCRMAPGAATDHHELRCRYCLVYTPYLVPDCWCILEEWRGREMELWDLCHASYGRDPSTLLSLSGGTRYDILLADGKNATVNDLILALGLPLPLPLLAPLLASSPAPRSLPKWFTLASPAAAAWPSARKHGERPAYARVS